MLAAAVAVHLAANVAGLTYDPTGVSGNVYVEHLPDTTTLAVLVLGRPGLGETSKNPWGNPGLQVQVRGAAFKHIDGHAMATAIHSELQCLDLVTLADGTPHEMFVVGCTATQDEPIPLGRNAKQQPSWSLNFLLSTNQPTAHRA